MTNKEKIMTLQQRAATWVMAKGLGVTVLVCWCLASGYIIKTQYERMNVMQTQFDQKFTILTGQMFDLQNSVIKDNTKAMTEFNLKNK